MVLFIFPFIEKGEDGDASLLSAVTFIINLSASAVRIKSLSVNFVRGCICSHLLAVASFLMKIDKVCCNLLSHVIDTRNVQMVMSFIKVAQTNTILTQVNATPVNIISTPSDCFILTV